MEHLFPEYTQCLAHQLPEDQSSPAGLVCPLCKQRLYVSPPRGRGFSCWESQPGAYTLTGEPCFVYTIVWEDFRIRSLHPAGVLIDSRSVNRTVIIADRESAKGLDTSSEIPNVEPTSEEFPSPEEFLSPEDDEFGLWRDEDEE